MDGEGLMSYRATFMPARLVLDPRVFLGIQSLSDRRRAFLDHLVIIESALLFAAALVVLVGGLGLTSTLTLNVIERTREIGILGAIGATPRTIWRNIVFEGVVMGVLS